MNNNDRLFVGREILKAVENDIKILLPFKRSLDHAAGWFSESPLELVATTNRSLDDFLGVFLHESCHMDQFLEQTDLWNAPEVCGDKDYCREYFLGNITRKSKKLRQYVQKVLELEVDCEKRALEKIKKYKLSIDRESYIQRGNCYLFSHRPFYEHRMWYADVSVVPSKNSALLESMPKKLLTFGEYWDGHPEINAFMRQHGRKRP